MRARFALAAATLLLTAAAGCGGGSGATKEVREPSGALAIKRGDTLVLAFAYSPGIGFAWQPAGPAPPRAVLEARGSSSDVANRPGASGLIRYRYAARGKGRARLVFVHYFRGKVLERRPLQVTVR